MLVKLVPKKTVKCKVSRSQERPTSGFLLSCLKIGFFVIKEKRKQKSDSSNKKNPLTILV